MSKTALITGIRGQDAAYLTQLLLEKGYTVYGGDRRAGESTYWRLKELGVYKYINFVPFDILEPMNIYRVIKELKPDELYNLAAQSFVGVSFKQPVLTTQVNALGVLHILEAIKEYSPNTRFYQASTSELFGKVKEIPQTENTPFHPRSPYGVAKLYAHWITINYREAYNLFTAAGILFNHESPLRGEEFVTRKITSTLAKIKYGLEEKLYLGNIEAKRDWGYARDYVKGMYLMLQQDKPDDYVLATGETHSVKEFVEIAARIAGFDISWEGTGVETKGIDKKSGKVIVEINPKFYRPAEVDILIGDATKAKKKLGWSPEVTFKGLVELMMEKDLERAKKLAK